MIFSRYTVILKKVYALDEHIAGIEWNWTILEVQAIKVIISQQPNYYWMFRFINAAYRVV